MIRTRMFVATVVLLISHNAFADSIIVFGGERRIVANATGQSQFALGDWSASYSTTTGANRNLQGFASQTSTLSTTFLGGQGFSEVRLLSGPTGPNISASSDLRGLIKIEENYLATLNIELFEGGGDFTSSTVRLREIGPFSNPNPIFNLSGTPGMTTFANEAVLAPGTYEFFIQAFATLAPNAQGSASFNGGLSLAPTTRVPDPVTPVPEPASLTLVALGLFGVGARRWRASR